MKILVPTAGAVPARETADYIVGLAQRLEAHLHVLHILRPEEPRANGRTALEVFTEAAQRAGVTIETTFTTGGIVPAIVAEAASDEADLIVMGASRGRVVSEWLGADVMSRSEIPVLVVPHEVGSLAMSS